MLQFTFFDKTAYFKHALDRSILKVMIWPSFYSWWIIEISQKCLFEWSKQPRMRIFTICLTLVNLSDLIIRILIQLNVVHDLTIPSFMLDHSITTKKPFWMIKWISLNRVKNYEQLISNLINFFITVKKYEPLDKYELGQKVWATW